MFLLDFVLPAPARSGFVVNAMAGLMVRRGPKMNPDLAGLTLPAAVAYARRRAPGWRNWQTQWP
jgi:hypothetical protein